MLKQKSISIELILMMVFSVLFHLFIIGSMIYYARASSRFNLSDKEKLNVIWATSVDRSLLKEYRTKLPPPQAPPQATKPSVSKKEAPKRVIEKKDRKQASPKTVNKREIIKEKEREKEALPKKDDRKDAIAKALSEIYGDLKNKPVPNPNNYNLKDYKDRGLPGGTGGTGDPGEAREKLAYMKTVESIIRGNFVKPLSGYTKGLEVRLTVKIDAEGEIVSTKVERGSGNAYFDRSVLRAVDKSSPLPPPPEVIRDEVIYDGIVIDFVPEE